MPPRTWKLVAGVIGAVLLWYFFFKFFNTPEVNGMLESSPESKDNHEPNMSEDYIPDGWSGLPISRENPLYKEKNIDPTRYEAWYLSLRKKLVLMNLTEWNYDDTAWDAIVLHFEPIIGWNGIFDAMDEAIQFLKIDPTMRLHKIGEKLYFASPLPRYVVEIASRNILHKAPLHGGVWEAIKHVGANNTEDLFDLVKNELCYFRSAVNMGNIWISCAHGVGHGLGDLFGSHQIDEALKVCTSQNDMQFQYACATGVFMALESEFEAKTFSPCDTNRYPGACYRFKQRLFPMILYNQTNACETQADEYHTIGCIWGRAYVAHAPPSAYYSSCEIYLPEIGASKMSGLESRRHAACIDGFFSSNELTYMPNSAKDGFCDELIEYPLSFEVCKNRLGRSFQYFTLQEEGEQEEDFFYNDKILEYDYQPSNIPTVPARWLSEWNHIVRVMPNNQQIEEPSHQMNHAKNN